MVGSFYDPMLDEGCAFEELISFHGGLGGPQTRPFILAPPGLPLPRRAHHRRRRGPRVLLGLAPVLAGGDGHAGSAADRALRPRPATSTAPSSSPHARARRPHPSGTSTPSLR